MKRNRRGWLYLLFGVSILGITLGYAYLNTELQINGTTNVSSASWNVYWNNIQLGSSNVTTVTTPATISTGKTEVSFNVDFKEPGDTYEFTVDAVNDGSIDAMISSFSKGVYATNGTTPKTLPDYLEYTVTYSDGIEIANKQLLESGKTETYKVRVHYKEDITASQLPSTADNYMFKFSVTYAQADDTAQEKPVPDFTTDSWETIINIVRNNPNVYELGDTKTVDMGTFGTHTLRIANTTTPAECSTEGFSQTACGFVLEFADIITTHNMNPSGEYKGTNYQYGWNVDGWPASSMRTYVNSDIYNALPTALKAGIIDTTVVSGHGSTTGEANFTSTDRLYLLSPMEVWGYNSFSYHDSARDLTRQIDYYNSMEIDNNHYSGVTKKYNNTTTYWWLRNADSDYNDAFGVIYNYGRYSGYESRITNGVSPAFRLG